MSPWFTAGRRLLLKARFRAQAFNKRILALAPARRQPLHFGDVRRRLELFISAAYGRAIPISPLETNIWNRERVRQLASRDARARDQMPSADGEMIYLPAELEEGVDGLAALSRYRLFAVEQAERIVRRTVELAPPQPSIERDLFLMREAAVIDGKIARAFPGLIDTLVQERRAALARRPALDTLSKSERAVEMMLRETLSAPLNAGEPLDDSVSASIFWAQETACVVPREERYRGLPAAPVWGTTRQRAPATETLENTDDEPQRTRESRFSASDAAGPMAVESSRDDYDAAPTPNSQNGAAAPIQQTTFGNGNRIVVKLPDVADLPPAVLYDEWDAARNVYLEQAAHVRLTEPADGGDEWASDAMRTHGVALRRVRQQFERLHPRRTLLSRQLSGDELDIAACVDAIIDRRAGNTPDDRLYLDARPAPRGIAIALLADVSGSTQTRITSDSRIIDVEKIALLLATSALDALGDPYAVYSFAGMSALNVEIKPLKMFAERGGRRLHRRIAGLEAGGFTRMGAALRHVSRQLANQSAGHRLLLLVSDGRPNDIDAYQGDYGIEDCRRALHEARGLGLFPYCMTVDRDAADYLPRIFGKTGYTILRRPEQMPDALLRVVRMLIGGR